jgi:hypothetical protein
VKIRVDFDRHPDFEDAKQVIINQDTDETLDAVVLIGRRIVGTRLENGVLIIELDERDKRG